MFSTYMRMNLNFKLLDQLMWLRKITLYNVIIP